MTGPSDIVYCNHLVGVEGADYLVFRCLARVLWVSVCLLSQGRGQNVTMIIFTHTQKNLENCFPRVAPKIGATLKGQNLLLFKSGYSKRTDLAPSRSLFP